MTDTTANADGITIESGPVPPGRLGDPTMCLGSDPRSDPRMIAAMAPYGLDQLPAPSTVTADGSSYEELLAHCDEAEAGFSAMFGLLLDGLPTVDNVSTRTEVIKGVDDNDISLYLHTPTDVDGPLPCLIHIHGGGMVILRADGPNFASWRNELASTGMMVIGVEFRNGGASLGPHPFPAGLNDCASAVQWANANKDTLGISHVAVSGESGGGNLSIATTLKAKAEGWVDQIAGVYAQCPYIYGGYANPEPSVASLFENDGYFLDMANMGALAKVYDPSGENATNPLAWPYHASEEDLVGLPPHIISVNELDPLRDEGLVFYRKLAAAGVSVAARTVNGTCHAGDAMFLVALSDIAAATIRDINSFVTSLAP